MAKSEFRIPIFHPEESRVLNPLPISFVDISEKRYSFGVEYFDLMFVPCKNVSRQRIPSSSLRVHFMGIVLESSGPDRPVDNRRKT